MQTLTNVEATPSELRTANVRPLCQS